MRSPDLMWSVFVLIFAAFLLLSFAFASTGENKHWGGELVKSPKIEALRARISKADPERIESILDEFVSENKGKFPLIEDNLVTFVYRGRVGLKATVPSDLNRWDVKAHIMKRLDETDLYYLTLTLPRDARIDYKFYVDNLWMLDPLNPQTVLGGFGPNSAFAMPGYVPPSEIEYVDSIPHGKVTEYDFTSNILNNTRKIHIYLPPGYDSAGEHRYPVVFVQDGGEYIMLASMTNVLDNLIFAKRIPPAIGIFIDPVDRNYEYYANPKYERMLIEELIPFVRKNYAIASRPRETAIMGVSLGGAISLMIALDHPEIFGNCGSQSGAFGIDDGKLYDLVMKQPLKRVAFYLDCGRFGDLLEDNQKMVHLLKTKGYALEYKEFNEGHSWGNWRAHIDDMLVFFWGKEGEGQ